MNSATQPVSGSSQGAHGVADADLVKRMREIVKSGDLQILTLGKVMKQLESEFRVNLQDRKQFINNEITRFVQGMDDAAMNLSALPPAVSRPAPQTEPVDRSTLSARITALAQSAAWQKGAVVAFKGHRGKIKRAPPAAARVNPNSGLNKPIRISKKLAEFVGIEWTSETALPRTQVVRIICDYVKRHNLQAPEDGRIINCDEKLQSLLGESQVTFFTLNKHLSAHFEKSKAARKPSAAVAGGAGFHVPCKISEELSALCDGKRYMSRPAVIRAVWKYIKDNKLQDAEDGRNICCDEKMQRIFSANKISMMNMNKVLNNHLQKIIPRSADEQEAVKVIEAEKAAAAATEASNPSGSD